MFMRWRWKLMTLFASLWLVFSYVYLSALPFNAGSLSFGSSRAPAISTPRCHRNGIGRTVAGSFHWGCVRPRFPVTPRSLPSADHVPQIPKIQAEPQPETSTQRSIRLSRLAAVKGNFTHAWKGYKDHAWLHDEVKPLTGGTHDPFGGWAATLVDSLDTLWILGLHDEFKDAVQALDVIDFTTCSLEELNVFETTIRYLGGFLAAYDLSGGTCPGLLQKAHDLGEMLYVAFDTPNRMPVPRWNPKLAMAGTSQVSSDNVLVAEIGSLTLEFTRLSQLTGDMRFYDAVQRIMDTFEEQQMKTKLPGLWPVIVNGRTGKFTEHFGFTIGGMADSLFEYLPKQHLLLGGAIIQYQQMYERALVALKQSIFFRPMVPKNESILFPGSIDSDGLTPVSQLKIKPQAQHLGCFAGGMVAIGSKIFGRQEDMDTARKLVEGCLWGYEKSPNGIMPEIMSLIPCESREPCTWDEQQWKDGVLRHQTPQLMNQRLLRDHIPQGVIKIDDTRYILRPEAIESVFILYRITGDESLRDRAWQMFNSIIAPTITDIAHAALDNCMIPNPPKGDRMESFWLAETLKYFYLIFSEPDLVSLDEYVLNTEAHPLRRPN